MMWQDSIWLLLTIAFVWDAFKETGHEARKAVSVTLKEEAQILWFTVTLASPPKRSRMKTTLCGELK